MSIYLITIQPVGADGKPAESSRAVVRVDTGGSQPRIIEMTLQSSAPSGLTIGSLPAVDLGSVVEALQAGILGADGGDCKAPEGVKSPSGVSEDLASTRQQHFMQSAAPLRTEPERGRAYRRMPNVVELESVYNQIGTVTGVAKHYGVPRHTAQGWMARLRKLTEQSK
ncbi:hypothetical protein [Mycobacterium sp. 852002-40037_SCH5390672]|uniref:hypothetical protein n=1 Tax=Mycobacterium sp. 852002-40037_SCH5390672 TaxID=1834089 RepID=UPI0012E98FA7|nr:hypothetical protein [Mycobacterium sp. 852002-40037_SCH5390672]